MPPNSAKVRCGAMAPAHWKREWAAGLAVVVTFLAMLALTWGKWPDVLVDFGHELYVPWQMSEGRAFGRDVLLVATGPLSPHINALLFKVFGAELRVLVAFNLLCLALLTHLLYVLVRTISDRLTATIACTTFLTIFAFGQYVGVGNYNYVTPYSHGVTHGLTLALLSIWLLHLYFTRRGWWVLVASGLTIGLVSLTKPEILVATGAAAGLRWCAYLRAPGRARDAACAMGVYVCTILLPPGALMMVLLVRMPLSEAWRVTATPWLLLATRFSMMPFYSASMGLDAPWRSLGALSRWSVIIALTVVLGVAAEMAARTWRVPVRAGAIFLFLLLALGLVLMVPFERWFEVARPLPVITLVGGATYAARVFMRPNGTSRRSGAALGLALSGFALALLGKMFLNTRIYHYGFALAMPAFMLAVVWLWWSLPEYLKTRGLDGRVFRCLAGAVLTVLAAVHVGTTLAFHRAKQVPVGSAGNAFISDQRGILVNEAVHLIQQAGSPGDTLTVLPEGVMVNFLARRTSPSPYLAYTPEMIAGFGEEAMLAPLRRAPPDLVLLVSRDSSEYGARTFGKDYALATLRWITEHYVPVARMGGSPLNPDEYGMTLMRRKEDIGEELDVVYPTNDFTPVPSRVTNPGSAR